MSPSRRASPSRGGRFRGLLEGEAALCMPEMVALRSRHDIAISRHVSPEVCWISLPSQIIEGAGKTGCSLHLRSRVQVRRKSAHEHTGSAEAFRPSLRSGFTAYFVLSPVNGSFATVIPEKLASQELDASTAASGPHDFAVRVTRLRPSRALRVHRIPPRVRDDRETPLDTGETRRLMPLICPTG